jgi:hypothetical protein
MRVSGGTHCPLSITAVHQVLIIWVDCNIQLAIPLTFVLESELQQQNSH